MAARGKLEPHDVHFFATTGDLRDWFDEHRATEPELWLGYHKKGTGRPSVNWSQAVDEALCVGWIDGILKRVDESTHVQRFTPRRKGSNWSAINVAKVAALTAEGRMRESGQAAFAARTDANTGVYAYERAEATFTDDETARFRADEKAWTDWQRRSPSYRRTVTHWVTSAKQAATRERRLSTLIADSHAGQEVGPMRTTRPDR